MDRFPRITFWALLLRHLVALGAPVEWNASLIGDLLPSIFLFAMADVPSPAAGQRMKPEAAAIAGFRSCVN